MITLACFVVLVLATARLTRAVTLDSITAPVRDWLESKLGSYHFVNRLINCYWCAGFWVAIFTSSFALSAAVYLKLMPLATAGFVLPLLCPAVAYAASWILDKEEN